MGNPMGPFTSSTTGSPGYRNVGMYQIAMSISFTEGENPSVGSASGLVRSVDGMTVSFAHEGKPESFSIGANQVMYLIAKVMIFLALLVVFAIVAWLVYGAA